MRSCRGAFLAGVLVLFGAGLSQAGAADAGAAQSPPYTRRDAEWIRAQARDILQAKPFADDDDGAAWADRLGAWLQKHFPTWLIPGEKTASAIATAVTIIVLGGCVLGLVLLIYLLVRWFGYRRFGRSVAVDGADAAGLFDGFSAMSYEELLALAAKLRDAGKCRDAIGALMVALLRWLEGAGVLAWEDGKTNGDYLREYPPALTGAGDFSLFVRAFDKAVYSGADCLRSDFERVSSMMQAVQANADNR